METDRPVAQGQPRSQQDAQAVQGEVAESSSGGGGAVGEVEPGRCQQNFRTSRGTREQVGTNSNWIQGSKQQGCEIDILFDIKKMFTINEFSH